MISIIVPTLNENKNIYPFISSTKKLNFIFEVIFVDDSSVDNTTETIKRLIKYKRNYRIIIRKKNRDLSQSVLEGVKKAKFNTIIVMDVDLQHDMIFCNKLYEKYKKKKLDLVIGSRFLLNSFTGNIGCFRSIVSLFTILMINFFFKKKSTDPLSGFFICKKNLLLDYKKKYFLKGYKILFDILYNGKKKIFLEDISILFRKRKLETSKFNFRIIFIFFIQIFYTKFRTLLNK